MKKAIQSFAFWLLKLSGYKPVQSDPNTIDCEICGCMVSKAKAIKGKGEMRDRIITMYECGNMPIEFIYYPHYCKRCAPKDKGQTRQRKKIDIK